jgi:thiol peroxidase
MRKSAERTGLVTLKGNPVTLLGKGVKAGDRAPDFTAVDAGWKPVRLSDFRGKVVLISAVPSLDTPVCSLQTKRFNDEAGKLPNVQVITISEDLPFAQKRFCDAEKIGTMVLSDTVAREFGLKYGLLIKGMSLLARCVIVVGADGVVKYVDLVPEITQHPDYDKALEAARQAAR